MLRLYIFLNSFQQFLWKKRFTIYLVIKLKVKIFDYEDERDLEEDVNLFIEKLEGEVIDIKYQVSVGVFSEEQVFCFSAMIIYIEK